MQECSVSLGGTTEICPDDFGWYNSSDHTKYIQQSQDFDMMMNLQEEENNKYDDAALNEQEKKTRRHKLVWQCRMI